MPVYEYTVETKSGTNKLTKIHHEPLTESNKASIRAHYLAYSNRNIIEFREVTEPTNKGAAVKKRATRRKTGANK